MYKTWSFLGWRTELGESHLPRASGWQSKLGVLFFFPLWQHPVLPEAGWKLQRGGDAREGNQGRKGQEQMWAPGEVIFKKGRRLPQPEGQPSPSKFIRDVGLGLCWSFVLAACYIPLPFACLFYVVPPLGRPGGSTWHARSAYCRYAEQMCTNTVQLCPPRLARRGYPLHICMANDVPLRVWGLST